jgi:hypothetical protein
MDDTLVFKLSASCWVKVLLSGEMALCSVAPLCI